MVADVLFTARGRNFHGAYVHFSRHLKRELRLSEARGQLGGPSVSGILPILGPKDHDQTGGGSILRPTLHLAAPPPPPGTTLHPKSRPTEPANLNP